MNSYNSEEGFLYVKPNFRRCRLAVAGDKFLLRDGTSVVLHRNDIRKLEVVAISQTQYGQFAAYSKNLMNILGGGEIGGNSLHQILYVRFGKKIDKIRKEKKEIEDNFYHGEIPMTAAGKIDWGKLIPNNEVVKRCGGELKSKKSTGKIKEIYLNR